MTLIYNLNLRTEQSEEKKKGSILETQQSQTELLLLKTKSSKFYPFRRGTVNLYC